jgi:hypothetical protein
MEKIAGGFFIENYKKVVKVVEDGLRKNHFIKCMDHLS